MLKNYFVHVLMAACSNNTLENNKIIVEGDIIQRYVGR